MPDSVNCNLLANEVSLTRQFQAISNRPRQAFRFNSPPGPELNNLFFLSVHDVTYVGRKLLSHSDERGWYQSSCLNPSQLLGQLLSIAYTNNGLAVHFISLEDSQRHDLFHAAIQYPDSEVYFPFPLLDSAGQECTLSQEQWACTPQLAGQLDNDEQHFRDYCAFFTAHDSTWHGYLRSGLFNRHVHWILSPSLSRSALHRLRSVCNHDRARAQPVSCAGLQTHGRWPDATRKPL